MCLESRLENFKLSQMGRYEFLQDVNVVFFQYTIQVVKDTNLIYELLYFQS